MICLFDGLAYYRNTEPNKAGNYVGLKLNVKSSIRIVQIGTQINGLVSELPIHIVNELTNTVHVNHSKPDEMVWSDVDVTLDRGIYYVGYLQDDLRTVNANQMKIDWQAKSSCLPCNRRGNEYSKFVDVVAFKSLNYSIRNLEESAILSNDKNYGLNLKLAI